MTEEIDEKIVGVCCEVCDHKFAAGLPPEAHGSVEGIMCPECASMDVVLDPTVVFTDDTDVVRRTCYGYGEPPAR